MEVGIIVTKTDPVHQLWSQVTGWSYYLWVLDVYPAMAGGVAKMRKEEEEET